VVRAIKIAFTTFNFNYMLQKNDELYIIKEVVKTILVNNE